MKNLLFVLVLGLVLASPAYAQSPGPYPLAAGAKATQDMIKGFITKAADEMPENLYAYRPTAEVRTFGQLVGHIADANYMICAAAAGEKAPAGDIEKTKTTKADLTKALADSFAYCDTVIVGTTAANATQMVRFAPANTSMPRLTLLSFNAGHDYEHYGNMVTYMRMNKMIPPSSQGNMGQ
jgi:uncharacterized damage-inducible protein DinB